jgi:hypothetical protein
MVRSYHVRGRSVYDCNIVATMVGHGVGELLTHNVKDFQRYVSDRLISVRRLV